MRAIPRVRPVAAAWLTAYALSVVAVDRWGEELPLSGVALLVLIPAFVTGCALTRPGHLFAVFAIWPVVGLFSAAEGDHGPTVLLYVLYWAPMATAAAIVGWLVARARAGVLEPAEGGLADAM